MIDLHIHTTYSDGTKNVIEILKQAEALKLDTISITDHESCDAHEELKKIDISKYYSGKIITGIELKTKYTNGTIDILGYGIDCTKMKESLKECYKQASREIIQEKLLKELYEYGKKYNLKLTPMEQLKWDKSREWGSIVFYEEMKSHEENKNKVPEDLWENFTNFNRRYYHSKGKQFYVDTSKYYPTLETITKIIHNAGGLAFVAHIYEYSWMENKIAELKKMIELVDGIECYHSIFSEENIETLTNFCKKHKVLMSGGSDYHGSHKPDIELGIGKGNLQIPNSILDNWNNYISI